MTDRDHFAAAALTGLINTHAVYHKEPPSLAVMAFAAADAMLRERERTADTTNHDAAPAARANAESVAPQPTAGDRSGNPTSHSGTGKQPAPPSVETDGFSSGSRTGQINRTPERQSPGRECGESSLRDVPQLDNSRAAGGPEPKSLIDVEELLGELHYIAGSGDHVEYDIRRTACEAEHAIDRLRAWVNDLQLSKVEVDAIQHVVEDGRLVDLADYGRLRSLLVKLRPEWEQEDGESDRPEPIKDAEFDRSQPINGPDPDSRVWDTPATHTTPPQGSVPREGTEPVAWATFYPNGSTASVYAGRQPPHAEPLYRHPQPTLTDDERTALRIVSSVFPSEKHAATLRGLLERLG